MLSSNSGASQSNKGQHIFHNNNNQIISINSNNCCFLSRSERCECVLFSYRSLLTFQQLYTWNVSLQFSSFEFRVHNFETYSFNWYQLARFARHFIICEMYVFRIKTIPLVTFKWINEADSQLSSRNLYGKIKLEPFRSESDFVVRMMYTTESIESQMMVFS